MPKEQKSEKPASTYQETYNKRTPREIWCGQVHSTIEEAIVHAERNLGACADENDVRISTLGLRKNVGALGNSRIFGSASVKLGHNLTS